MNPVPLAVGFSPSPTLRRDSLFARKESLLKVFDGSDVDEWVPGDELLCGTGTTGVAAIAPPSIATLLADEQEGAGRSSHIDD